MLCLLLAHPESPQLQVVPSPLLHLGLIHVSILGVSLRRALQSLAASARLKEGSFTLAHFPVLVFPSSVSHSQCPLPSTLPPQPCLTPFPGTGDPGEQAGLSSPQNKQEKETCRAESSGLPPHQVPEPRNWGRDRLLPTYTHTHTHAHNAKDQTTDQKA